MTDILTAEDEKYLAQHAHSRMTREDVVMLEILAAKLEREGREWGLVEGGLRQLNACWNGVLHGRRLRSSSSLTRMA